MREKTKETDYEAALEACAAEPIHIPGTIQPFGCLIGVDGASRKIAYASENCGDLLGLDAVQLLGAEVEDTLGPEIGHAINNAKSGAGYTTSSTPLGAFNVGDNNLELHAFGSDGFHVLQFERARDEGLGGKDALNTLGFLMGEIQNCSTQQSLFDLTMELMRHVSGYDRVMIYKFDPDFNGEVVAEARQRGVESYLGLRFPSWDIPAQARTIMKKLPLRFIEDAGQTPVRLLAANASLPPLDISYAECRGVSSVHMEYLENMNVQATMTLSIVVEDALWGIISFHHRRPRVPTPKMRELLTAFLNVFTSKLNSLIKQTQLDLVRRTDSIKDSVLSDLEGEEALEGSISRIGAVVEDVLKADGIAFMNGSGTYCYGRTPDQGLLDHVFAQLQTQLGKPIVTDGLKDTYPDFADGLGGCAGMIASAVTNQRGLLIFRGDAAQTVSWAGNPEKEISQVSGSMRLAPRGSFSTYLQNVEARSLAWTADDIYFAERIWVLINSAESRALKNTLTRQQTLMINELNHRVLNILTLVRSVSRQARRHNGSVESYSASLENRVQALAAAHDIASGTGVNAIDIQQLIKLETSPYSEGRRINISGEERSLRASIVPIFSLVIHEMTTNAAKYGALSADGGRLDIVISDKDDGALITWKESGGPVVRPVKKLGFGTMLIEQAIPHEMGGTAKLMLNKDGVEAEFFLPNDTMENGKKQLEYVLSEQDNDRATILAVKPFDPALFEGFVLLLEDNFVIAKDVKDQLGAVGLEDIAIFSTASTALEVLETEHPVFAILDVNLGSGSTSEPVAMRLLQLGVPFVFATGYGSNAILSPILKDIPRLPKPVDTLALQTAMMESLG